VQWMYMYSMSNEHYIEHVHYRCVYKKTLVTIHDIPYLCVQVYMKAYTVNVALQDTQNVYDFAGTCNWFHRLVPSTKAVG
jgi:hypothetical protein